MLRQKLGPLEVWQWLALITVILLGWYLWSKRSGGAGSAAAASDTAPEIVVQDGTQATTPPANELTGAQEKELAALPGEVEALQDEEQKDARSGRRHKPRPRRRGRAPGPKTRGVVRPGQPVPVGGPGRGKAAERPGVTAGRHLATSHVTAD